MKLLVDKPTFGNLVSKYRNGAMHKAASFKRTNYYVLLLGKANIMRRANGRLETAVITDGETRLVKLGENEFIADTSQVTFVTDNEHQLPTRMVELGVSHIVFKLAKNAVVSLNYELLGNGNVRDVWFDIDDGFVDNVMAMEDVNTFLSS